MSEEKCDWNTAETSVVFSFDSPNKARNKCLQNFHHRSLNKHNQHHIVCTFLHYVFNVRLRFHHKLTVSCSRHLVSCLGSWFMWTPIQCFVSSILFVLPLFRCCVRMILWWLRIDTVISNYNTQSLPSLPVVILLFLLCCPVVCSHLNIKRIFYVAFSTQT